ncbi:hypothetical protein LCL61_14130 [Amycolatopsis coloradensis]|uniref:Uncharacterized protein n=1 Tax=Amycolatopsis coloradensis TaxID=76021 RepID=A0ACD5BBH1_9PSEU
MTTAPFEPNPHTGEVRIAAADAGPGAPEPAEGFGPVDNEDDTSVPPDDEDQ